MARIPLPYGMDLFEQVRREHCYYIDKTHLISEMMRDPFKVNLITRPQRFGETEIYCPWDVLLHVRALRMKPDAKPSNHWIDTSHNNIKGYRTIICYGAAFIGKECLIRRA